MVFFLSAALAISNSPAITGLIQDIGLNGGITPAIYIRIQGITMGSS
ncbi:MAG: hypothetical protein PVH58_15920 [Desulfobacterales bacterium]